MYQLVLLLNEIFKVWAGFKKLFCISLTLWFMNFFSMFLFWFSLSVILLFYQIILIYFVLILQLFFIVNINIVYNIIKRIFFILQFSLRLLLFLHKFYIYTFTIRTFINIYRLLYPICFRLLFFIFNSLVTLFQLTLT